MNLLTIQLTVSCNKRCGYCPVGRWLQPEGHELNKLTQEALLKWLGKYISPEEWVIEITGGEPGLHKEIGTLVPEMGKRGYKGIVKTNGSLPVPKAEGFQVISAWHKGEEFTKNYYDQILIIKNPDDDWEAKARHCEENGIPYGTAVFDRVHEGVPMSPGRCRLNHILKSCHILSDGTISKCSAGPFDREVNIFNMSEPVVFGDLSKRCPRCKNVNDVEKWLPPGVREKVDSDYEAHIRSLT